VLQDIENEAYINALDCQTVKEVTVMDSFALKILSCSRVTLISHSNGSNGPKRQSQNRWPSRNRVSR
jgi:hypothetical protein